MAVSFGLAKKIIDHPSYNLGLALPFVCAFYIMNVHEDLVVPLLGYRLSAEVSMVLTIFGVSIYYIASLFMFVLAGTLSIAVDQSKAWLILVAFFAAFSVLSYFSQDNVPRIGLLFGALSVVYLSLVFLKMENGSLSFALISFTGLALSLLSFVLGILWFDGHYLFQGIIAGIFGFEKIANDSLRLGSIMLITSGYVIFYAVFEANEVLSPR